jgi:hypothetical protein
VESRIRPSKNRPQDRPRFVTFLSSGLQPATVGPIRDPWRTAAHQVQARIALLGDDVEIEVFFVQLAAPVVPTPYE